MKSTGVSRSEKKYGIEFIAKETSEKTEEIINKISVLILTQLN